MKQNLVPPDIFRLRYRQALGAVVAAIVRNDEAPTEGVIGAHMPSHIPQTDRAHFVALALAEFNSLHSGNAVRFGLRPLELAAWREKQR
ncbi:hypothetical protein [Leptothrix ochracea]|uniref:hypothetical protein n=1 Tax=Leptothrix ochracea TaxID=735331 RepID=UPI0034E2624E